MRGRNHNKWALPNGIKYVFASTPSDRRSNLNDLKHLERILKACQMMPKRK